MEAPQINDSAAHRGRTPPREILSEQGFAGPAEVKSTILARHEASY